MKTSKKPTKRKKFRKKMWGNLFKDGDIFCYQNKKEALEGLPNGNFKIVRVLVKEL